jgi:hypothetical protein
MLSVQVLIILQNTSNKGRIIRKFLKMTWLALNFKIRS